MNERFLMKERFLMNERFLLKCMFCTLLTTEVYVLYMVTFFCKLLSVNNSQCKGKGTFRIITTNSLFGIIFFTILC